MGNFHTVDGRNPALIGYLPYELVILPDFFLPPSTVFKKTLMFVVVCCWPDVGVCEFSEAVKTPLKEARGSHLQYPLLNQQAPFCGGRRSLWLWKSDDLRPGRRGTDFESCHCGGEVWHKIARFQDELHKFALNFEISDLQVIAHDESLYIHNYIYTYYSMFIRHGYFI